MNHLSTAFCLLISLGSTCLAGEQLRPNILWISCEDISPHLGCYGVPQATTPNLDRLAEQGVRYTHAFTVAGVCALPRIDHHRHVPQHTWQPVHALFH